MSDGKDKKVQNNENENQIIEEQNQNFDEVSELDNSEEVNELDKSFVEIDEDEDVQKANLWWDNLQTTLDDAGCEIDLTQPEDTARLNIIEYYKYGPDQYEFTNTYALDPEERKIDIITIKDEEVLKRQETKNVSDDVKLRMYNAAKEGHLFVSYHMASKIQFKQRQILIDENGLPKVGNDIDHINDREADAIRLLDKPTKEKPQKPSDNIYKKAEKGDKNARNTIRSYERTLGIYNENMEIWNRAQEIKESDPDFYNKIYSLAVTAQQYFGAYWIEGFGEAYIAYQKRVTEMHKNSVLNKMPEDLRNAHIYLEEVTKKLRSKGTALRESMGGKSKGSINFSSAKILSEFFIYRAEMIRVKNLIDTGDVKNLQKMSDEEFEQKLSALRESEQYKVGFLTLNAEELDGMLMSEEEKFYSKLDKIIKKTNDNSVINLEEKKNLSRDEMIGLLQKVLNEGGLDINVNSKEDLARLYISEIDNNNFCTMRYATDPEQKPIDADNITKEEIIKRQGDIFDEKTLDRIINAAKEGRLFAEGHMNQKPPVGAKQIVLNDDNKFIISKNPEELTGDEAEAFEMLKKPSEVTDPVPGGFDKFLAFCGNKKAKTKINRYESAVRDYNTAMEKWNRVQQMDKTVRDRARNYSFSFSGFFRAVRINEFDYKDCLTELHREAEIKKLDFIDNRKEREMEMHYEELREEIVKISKNYISLSENEFVKSDEIINDSNAFIFATALVARKEMLRIDKIRENKDFDNYEPKSFEQISDEAMELYNSPAFKEYAKSTSNATLITIYESIKTEKYLCLVELDNPLSEVMPEDDNPERVVDGNINNNEKQVEKNLKNDNKVKNEEKIRNKLYEYKGAFDNCMTYLKGFMFDKKDLNLNIKKDEDLAKTLAMVSTISKEMKNIGNKKENEWKSIDDLKNESKKYYESNAFKEMSNFIMIGDVMKVVKGHGSLVEAIDGIENIINNADQKVKLESTIERPVKKENEKEINIPNVNLLNH